MEENGAKSPKRGVSGGHAYIFLNGAVWSLVRSGQDFYPWQRHQFKSINKKCYLEKLCYWGGLLLSLLNKECGHTLSIQLYFRIQITNICTNIYFLKKQPQSVSERKNFLSLSYQDIWLHTLSPIPTAQWQSSRWITRFVLPPVCAFEPFMESCICSRSWGSLYLIFLFLVQV